MQSAKPHILDLPDELLLRILDDHDITSSLYFLSLLSRRLHYICLPLFLAHHGVENPTDKVEIGIFRRDKEIDTISALRIALFVPQINCIRFSYSPYLTCDSRLHCFLAQTLRFKRLLQKLKHVESIILTFGALCDLCMKESGKFDEVSSLIKDLLDTAVQKSCSSLNVSVYCWKDIVRFQTTMEDRRWFGRQLVAIQESVQHWLRPKDFPLGICGKGWKFVAEPFDDSKVPVFDTTRSKLVPIIDEQLALESLVIRSPALLIPPLSSWTFDMLRMSKITRLELNGFLSSLELDAWSAVLPCISQVVQNVSCLSITQCDIHIVDILIFLAHLPKLTHLELDDRYSTEPLNTFRGRCTKTRRQHPDFPLLVYLRAPTDLVQYFIGKPRPLPKLESLCLVTHSRLRELDTSLSFIYHHLSEAAILSHRACPVISLDMQYSYQNDIRDDMDDFRQCTPSGAFQYVSQVILGLHMTNHPENPFADPPRVTVAQAVLDWLALFTEASQAMVKLRVFHEDVQLLLEDIKRYHLRKMSITLDVNGTVYN